MLAVDNQMHINIPGFIFKLILKLFVKKIAMKHLNTKLLQKK